MDISAVRLRPAALLAAVLAQACLTAVGADPIRAQEEEDAEARARAAAVARADQIRDTLTQPPGDRGFGPDDVIRLPFRLFGAALTVAALPPLAVYAGARKLGLDTRLAAWNEQLEAADIHPRVQTLGSRSWPGLVLRYDGLDPFFVEGGASLRGYTLARAGLSFGDTLRGAEVAGTHHRMTQLHTWGVGMDSPATARSDYALTLRAAEAGAWTALAPHVRLRVDGGWEESEVDRGADDRRTDLQDRPELATLFGVAEPTTYLRGGAGLDLDWTRWDALQVTGFRAVGRWDAYRGLSDTDSDFQRVRGDAYAYVPFTGRHALALHAMAEDHLAEDGAGVPFHHLARLGDDDGLRGFRSWRFRDRALLAAMLEWRYEVWFHPGDGLLRVEGFAFVDHGGVGPSLGAVDTFETTPGLGMRFLTPGTTWGETYVAWGGEKSPRFGVSVGTSF